MPGRGAEERRIHVARLDLSRQHTFRRPDSDAHTPEATCHLILSFVTVRWRSLGAKGPKNTHQTSCNPPPRQQKEDPDLLKMLAVES